MKYFFSLVFLVIGLTLVLGALKRIRRRELMSMFREYNESGQLSVITDWIRKKNLQARLADVLDFLQTIQEDELGLKVVLEFEQSVFTTRHLRIFALRAYKYQDRKDEAIQAAKDLLDSFLSDDSILEMYIDVHLYFGEWQEAERVLKLRLERKVEGTIWKRSEARILAAKGRTEEAVELLTEVVRKEYSLYKNTFAPAQKRLIYMQYAESQQILDQITGEETELIDGPVPEEKG